MTDSQVPAAWGDLLTSLTSAKGRVLVVGPVDCGKTTFTTLLAARRAAQTGTSFVIDADLGQSEIGPPACVSIGKFTREMSVLSEAQVILSSFVGATSPAGITSSIIEAVCHSIDAARDENVIVDTGGYATKPEAWLQISCLAAVVRPTNVVILQRGNEAAPLQRILGNTGAMQVHVPPLADSLQVKSREYRTQRRRLKFAAALHDAEILEFDFQSVPVIPTWLGAGAPLPAHLFTFAKQALAPSIRVYHAEQWGNQLGLLVSALPHPSAPAIHGIRSATKTSDVHCIPAPALKNKLVGLVAKSGTLLALGILEKLDCKRGIMGIRTNLRTAQSATALHLGRLSLRADGSEIN